MLAFRVQARVVYREDRDQGCGDYSASDLFWFKSERIKLSAPFGRRIAGPLDADAAWQATFYGGLDEIWSEEGERDRHVNVPNAAPLAHAKFGDFGYSPRQLAGP
jgi:hypothetical protein